MASVGAQRYPNIELLIVAASKGIHSPVPRKAGPFPIKMRPPTSRGLGRSEAANIGLEMASGEFALFLDDDDWIEPQHIEHLVQKLESEKTSGAIACYSETRCVDAEGTPRSESFKTPYDPIRLLVGNFIPIHSCLFRLTPQTRRCQFDSDLSLYEDWDFWMQLSEVGPFLHSKQETAIYRLGFGSGFGVGGWGSSSARSAYRQVLDKWRMRWSLDEVESIVERARMSYSQTSPEDRHAFAANPSPKQNPAINNAAPSMLFRLKRMLIPSKSGE